MDLSPAKSIIAAVAGPYGIFEELYKQIRMLLKIEVLQLDADASAVRVLLQKGEQNRQRLVYCVSKRTTGAESKYQFRIIRDHLKRGKTS